MERLIGDRVRQAREARGMTQAELSQALRDRGSSHFHPTTISRIEKGERPLRLSDALALSSVLDTSVDNFRPRNAASEMFGQILRELEGLRGETRRTISNYHQIWWSAVRWYAEAVEDGHVIEGDVQRMFARKLTDPDGFEKDIALAVRVAKELNRGTEDPAGYLDKAREYGERFAELAREEDGDGVDPEA